MDMIRKSRMYWNYLKINKFINIIYNQAQRVSLDAFPVDPNDQEIKRNYDQKHQEIKRNH